MYTDHGQRWRRVFNGACTHIIHYYYIGKADGCPTSNYPWENDRIIRVCPLKVVREVSPEAETRGRPVRIGDAYTDLSIRIFVCACVCVCVCWSRRRRTRREFRERYTPAKEINFFSQMAIISFSYYVQYLGITRECSQCLMNNRIRIDTRT